ncbi:hypothetical protein V5799_029060, partial [Amblyomma americanum]
ADVRGHDLAFFGQGLRTSGTLCTLHFFTHCSRRRGLIEKSHERRNPVLTSDERELLLLRRFSFVHVIKCDIV